MDKRVAREQQEKERQIVSQMQKYVEDTEQDNIRILEALNKRSASKGRALDNGQPSDPQGDGKNVAKSTSRDSVSRNGTAQGNSNPHRSKDERALVNQPLSVKQQADKNDIRAISRDSSSNNGRKQGRNGSLRPSSQSSQESGSYIDARENIQSEDEGVRVRSSANRPVYALERDRKRPVINVIKPLDIKGKDDKGTSGSSGGSGSDANNELSRKEMAKLTKKEVQLLLLLPLLLIYVFYHYLYYHLYY